MKRIHTHPPRHHWLVAPCSNVVALGERVVLVARPPDPPVRILRHPTRNDLIPPRIVTVGVSRNLEVVRENPRAAERIEMEVRRLAAPLRASASK